MMQYDTDAILVHHGIIGQRWGVRRYQDADGKLTKEGYEHYRDRLGYSRERKKIHLRRAIVGTAVGVGLGAVAGLGLYTVYPQIMAYANAATSVGTIGEAVALVKAVEASAASGAMGQLAVQSLATAGFAAGSAVSLGAAALNTMGFTVNAAGTAFYKHKLKE